MALIDWLLIPANNAIITWIGFAIGVAGTFLGLLGIAIALKQLKAIKNETEAAGAAISSVQLKVASFDAAEECRKASDLLVSIRTNLKISKWDQIISSYEDLIQAFLNLSHSTSLIEGEDRLLLQKHTQDMAKMCEAVRRRLAEGDSIIVLKGQDRALRNFTDILTKISFTVMRSLQQ
ncbi:hypothetical protein [Sphingobium algorifonticola]|uniref:Uncharacterized protein n=1 Tax=Sphingobium algorifonticola TaxID=2008318 RepID=A0A437J9B6_9SPHN|nr:hypothetical protein [Sphingobium algorifonticola]RVT42109.1 hypothetical protein ENE74_07740 [Sphingobium algorifonticola]